MAQNRDIPAGQRPDEVGTVEGPQDRKADAAVDIESVVYWTSSGASVGDLDRDVADMRVAIADAKLIWVHVQLPDRGRGDHRGGSPDWKAVLDLLEVADIDPQVGKGLGRLLARYSPRAEVVSTTGFDVVSAVDETHGKRRGIRFARLTMVTLSNRVVVSARHRDGFSWIDSVGLANRELLRHSVGRKRDPLRASALRATVLSTVRSAVEPKELIGAIVLAASGALPRGFGQLNGVVRSVENGLSAEADSADSQSKQRKAAALLLNVLNVVGSVEAELRRTQDDLTSRDNGSPALAAGAHNLALVRADLARLRQDARATIDMIGSTVASAQLTLARTEAQSTEKFARFVTVFTSVLLVPTVFAGLFGANVKFPGSETEEGFWLMTSLIAAGATLTYGIMRDRLAIESHAEEGVEHWVRRWPYGLSTASFAAAFVVFFTSIGVDSAEPASGEVPAVAVNSTFGQSPKLKLSIDLSNSNCPCDVAVGVGSSRQLARSGDRHQSRLSFATPVIANENLDLDRADWKALLAGRLKLSTTILTTGARFEVLQPIPVPDRANDGG